VTITETGDPFAEAAALRLENRQLEDTVEVLQESLAELELDDRDWVAQSARTEQEFSGTGRQRIVEICRYMSISHPLLKRGLAVRAGYIWGQGVEVLARVADTEGNPDKDLSDQVNQIIDAHEKLNESTFSGVAAHEEKERALGTDGEVFLALFTNPATGEVRIRSVPQTQVQLIVSNPEDDAEPWFYVREYTVPALPKADQSLASPPTTTVRCIYPALGFEPRNAGLGFKPRQLNDMTVMWDAPMVHVPVNRLDGWKRGIPDVYASVTWARLYRDFLIDWSLLTKSLSTIAWKATGESQTKASKAAAAINATVAAQHRAEGTELPQPRTALAGSAAAMYGVNLEAVSKSGATIDSTSGQPLAAMIAAGMGVPVTVLLSDPGVTGARAVAETLTSPQILEMGMRRLLWQSAMTRILRHVIATAAMQPGSQLRALTGDREPVLEFNWPPLARLDPAALVGAIVQADATEKMPPTTTLRLLLGALGVPNVDEVVAEVTDAQGNWKPLPGMVQQPTTNAGQAAADAARKGQDPNDPYNRPPADTDQ